MFKRSFLVHVPKGVVIVMNEFDNQSSVTENHHISDPYALVIIVCHGYYSPPSSFNPGFVWHDISYTGQLLLSGGCVSDRIYVLMTINTVHLSASS